MESCKVSQQFLESLLPFGVLTLEEVPDVLLITLALGAQRTCCCAGMMVGSFKWEPVMEEFVESGAVSRCEFLLGILECHPVDIVAVLVGPLKFFLKVDAVVGCLCCMPECLSKVMDDDVSMNSDMRIGMW